MNIQNRINKYLGCWLPLVILALSFYPAQAQEKQTSLNKFTELFDESFSLYREAASYIRTGNLGVAAIQLEETIKNFNLLRLSITKAPAPYDRNENFIMALDNISNKLDQSLNAIDDEDQSRAWALVAEIRSESYHLQTASGLYNLSTCIYDLNSSMDQLWPYYKNKFDIDDEKMRNNILTLNAEVALWVRRCEKLASADVKSSDEFTRLFDTYKESKITIRESMEARDKSRFIRIMGEIRSLDRLIFLRFG